MPVHKLDAAFCMIASCEPGKRKTDYYDVATKGFVLECRAGGGKSFYLRYQDAHGRQKQHRIAGYGDASFHKIREEAKRLRSEITLGGDPAGVKAEKKAVPLYSSLADDHIAHARTYMKSIKTLEGYMKRIKKRWGKMPLTDSRRSRSFQAQYRCRYLINLSLCPALPGGGTISPYFFGLLPMHNDLPIELNPLTYAERDQVYRNLYDLKERFGPKPDRQVRAEVMIGACIAERFDTAQEIIKALGANGLSHDHIVKRLHARTGCIPGDHLWQCDADGRYHLLSPS